MPLTPEQAQHLADARRQCRERGTPVLDTLTAALGAPDAMALLAACGVECVTEADPSWQVTVTPADTACVQVRWPDGRMAWLLADPLEAPPTVPGSGPSGFAEPCATTGALLQQLAATHAAPEASAAPPPTAQPPGASIALEPELHTGSAVELVSRAIQAALAEGASDIHFECDRQGLSVKLRLDGVMRPLLRQDGVERAEAVISRIKVLAQLDITERRLPQDGRFRHEQRGANVGRGVDLRVSIMPSVFGEDAVLRLLDKSHLRASNDGVTLEGLGFAGAQIERLRRLAHQPNGMVLVTGPTGSGKTTTVYAALSEINTGIEKIITIEDPVEYELPGVLQIPVNERKGLTFAVGLRSILRHDPDRILVGEIRDAETAGIAVQSALTGHLVFTTVHANSLFDVIGRFRHFGIDMFGFVSALNGVVVQRLLRQLCKACRGTRPVAAAEREWFAEQALPAPARLPAAHGCPECHGSGYRGRFVVAEVHVLSDAFRDLVVRQAEVTQLKQLAFAEGRDGPQVPLLLHAALQHVAHGETTLEEVYRVVGRH